MTEQQYLFVETFEPIRERLWRFIRAMVFRYDDVQMAVAEDIMSDTIVQAMERFDSLRQREALLAFCFTIASRLYKSQFVRRKYWGLYEQDVAEQVSSTDATPDVNTDIMLLYEALDKLPVKIKEAVILFEISDLSLESIRVIQGGTLSGVKSRVTRGRGMLTRLLSDDNSDRVSHSKNAGELGKRKSSADGTVRYDLLLENS